MATAMTAETGKQVARPLRVLVPLIKEDLRHGTEAAKNAAIPYYTAAGEKMIEARPQMTATEFDGWTKRNFNVGRRQANEYMNLARHNSGSGASQRTFTSLRDVVHQTRDNPNYGKPASWQEPVRQIIGKVDVELLNIRKAEMARADERDAQRTLALQLIDIGYKALATKLHPDKGGSRDAMMRLNQVRDRLKAHA